jgi:hypothetical protein
VPDSPIDLTLERRSLAIDVTGVARRKVFTRPPLDASSARGIRDAVANQ